MFNHLTSAFYCFIFQYKEAIPHLKLSVELNNIQEDVWIRLGFAALETEDWKLAVTAYKRYCALEQTVCIVFYKYLFNIKYSRIKNFINYRHLKHGITWQKLI